MTEPADVSVVVPTRDRVPFLMRALAAANCQVGVSTEIVVVDDGTGEGAAAAAGLGLAGLRTLETGGAGQVAARNLGVGAARGAIVAFLDDDDWWDDDHHLARLAHALGGRAGLAYASGEIVHETAGRERLGALPFHAHADAASIRRDNTLLVSGVAFGRDVIRRVGPFDGTLPCYWDWDFYLRVFAAGAPVADGGGKGVRISARAGTVSAGDNAEARRRDLDRLADKHGLGRLVLKNHEGIAAEQAAGGTAGRT